MINVAIYPRKSKQVDNSDSMDIQIDMCKRYLDSKYGANYNAIVYDKDYGITGHSASKRKDFQRMMNDVRSGKIQLVVIQRYDRIARNTRDFCNLYHDMEINNCELVSVSQQIDTTTPYGKKFMYDQASMAELEWALTSERRKDAYAYGVRIGKCMIPDHSIPFGYKAERIDGIRRMVKDENEEPIVNDIFDHYKLYRNYSSCGKYVNEKYNMSIEVNFIKRIIRGTFYKGEYRGNNDFCPKYIEVDEWNDLQRKIPLIRNDMNKRNEILFSGMIRCPVCHRKMRAVNKRKADRIFRYYHCEYHNTRMCSFKRVKSEILIENMLIEKVNAYLEQYSAKATYKSGQKNVNTKKYEKELERLNIMYQKGRIDDNYYDSEYERLTAIISQRPIEDMKVKEMLSADWLTIYQGLDKMGKKLFWREIVEEIIVNEDMEVTGVVYR